MRAPHRMASPGDKQLVLVTGVSGSIAGAMAKALLAAGYRVRGTVRDVNNQASVRAPPRADAHAKRQCARQPWQRRSWRAPPTRKSHGHSRQALPRRCARAAAACAHRAPATQVGHLSALCPGLELVTADLLKDEGWDAACAGVKYVHHIASPFPLGAARPCIVRLRVALTRPRSCVHARTLTRALIRRPRSCDGRGVGGEACCGGHAARARGCSRSGHSVSRRAHIILRCDRIRP
jgi:hypothetical protein